MIATLILGCVLSGAAGFLAGWFRGRRDVVADLDRECGEILDDLKKIPTHCTVCDAGLVAVCLNGCKPSLEKKQ